MDAVAARAHRSRPELPDGHWGYSYNREPTTLLIRERAFTVPQNARANPSQDGDAKPPVSNLTVRDSGATGKRAHM